MMCRSQRGVTLIEVLIAVSLLGLLTGAVITSLRVGMNALDRTNSVVIANRRAVSIERILQQQIAGFMPVIAPCPQPPDGRPVAVAFFEGHPQIMRFVSSYSLQEASRGLPRILEYAVIPAAEGNGVRLIVNERLYTGPVSAGVSCLGVEPVPELGNMVLPRFKPVEAEPQSFVLADKLASCRFSYRQPLPPPGLDTWVSDWARQTWPLSIRVDMEQLAPDPSRSPLIGVVAPVHVNRDPKVDYDQP